jgi:hypothetical protein
MAPVTAAERIGAIDILRGLALFGILAANMRAFNAPFEVYDNIAKLFPGTADRRPRAIGSVVSATAGDFVGDRDDPCMADLERRHFDPLCPYRIILLLFRKRSQNAIATWAIVLTARPGWPTR